MIDPWCLGLGKKNIALKRKRKTAHSKRRKIENMMIPNDVLHNILCRLSSKPLMRFRCASKHFNSLVTDPYFINSRSRRMLLISSSLSHLNYALDEKHPNIIVPHTYPFQGEIQKSNVLGTFNGIVILVLQTASVFACPRIFILYNPLTRAAKKLPDPPFNLCCAYSLKHSCACGFGDGKIIFAQYGYCRCPSTKPPYCSVFSLKKGSWTNPKPSFSSPGVVDEVGVYLNGILYWIDDFAHIKLFFTALDIKKMRSWYSLEPQPLSRDYYQLGSFVLGTCNGCLCMIAKWRNGFDVWMRTKNDNEGIEWSKQYSFASPFYRDGFENILDICILEDRRIFVRDEGSNQVIICHLSKKHGYDIFESTTRIGRFKRVINYVESLASPSDYKSLSYA